MVITSTTNCCLNLPPPSVSALTPKTTTQVAWQKKEGSWRRQCVVGVACMIIGLEMGGERLAVAKDVMTRLVAVESDERRMKWSDKRRCPPWHTNALEIIVPENLPRPTAHRRWEAVAYSGKASSVAKIEVGSQNKCFSM